MTTLYNSIVNEYQRQQERFFEIADNVPIASWKGAEWISGDKRKDHIESLVKSERKIIDLAYGTARGRIPEHGIERTKFDMYQKLAEQRNKTTDFYEAIKLAFKPEEYKRIIDELVDDIEYTRRNHRSNPRSDMNLSISAIQIMVFQEFLSKVFPEQTVKIKDPEVLEQLELKIKD
jgi:hypothetical protein